MGWTAADVGRYLGISRARLDELRFEDSFPHAEWTREGQQLWRPGDVRLWSATHLEMLQQHRRSSNTDRIGT